MSQPLRNGVPGMDLPDLAELPLPVSVSLFPQTLAWKVLLAVAVLLLLALLLLLYRRYLRRRWKRQARTLAEEARRSGDIAEWFVLIKRVSLVHLPREQLATLSDTALLDQLAGLEDSTRQTLVQGHYSRQERLDDNTSAALAGAFEDWLKDLPDAR